MKTSQLSAALALAAAALSAQATVYSFNATLNSAGEVFPGSASAATGLATLSYDDLGTVSVLDDTFSLILAVNGLSGPATAYHLHGAATASENGPVRVSLDSAPFLTSANSGGLLVVTGFGIPVASLLPSIDPVPATPASGLNAGHPSMSFLAMLQGGLAYMNVHTATYGGGEVRGQLIQVGAVPEPSSYALLLGGLGLITLLARRRSR